jgi:hypothetical protein
MGALKEMGKLFSITPDEVDMKLINISSQYLRERYRYEKMKKSGEEKKFHSKWFGYSLMSFLSDRNKPRKCRQAGLPDIEVNTCFSKSYYIGTNYIPFSFGSCVPPPPQIQTTASTT